MESPQKIAKIVLVEDERAVADIIAFALEAELPVKLVAKFPSLVEAKANLAELKPDIIITDWKLADGLGGELIRSMSEKLPDTKWLLFTAWALPFVLREAFPAGVSGCVSKGGPITELFKAVKALLEGQTYYCEISHKALRQVITGDSLVKSLNPTELKILRCIAEGMEAKEIGDTIDIAQKTVHNYLSGIRLKLKRESMVDLAKFAVENGIARK